MIGPTPPRPLGSPAPFVPPGAFIAPTPTEGWTDNVRPVASGSSDDARVLNLFLVAFATGRTDQRGWRGQQDGVSPWLELHLFGRYLGVYW